jgi:AI-2E family transporter
MNQDPALVTSEDDERAKVRKAQEVVERTSASVAQVCLIILTLLAIVYTLYVGAGIILPFVLALVLAMVLGPAMRAMNRRLHIPRIIAALLLIIALFSVVGALGYALSVPASAWISKAPQSLPALMDKLSFLQRPIQLFEQGLHELQNAMSPGEQAGQQVVTVKQPSDVSRRPPKRDARPRIPGHYAATPKRRCDSYRHAQPPRWCRRRRRPAAFSFSQLS